MGVVFTTLAAVCLLAGGAKAADFTISFDQAVINTGGVTPSQLPGVNRNDGGPAERSDVVRLSGTVSDEGVVAIPGDGVSFKSQDRGIWPAASFYTIDWRSPGGFNGTFDHSTGKLILSGDLEQTITQLSNRCSTGPIPVTLSTEGSTINSSGERFTGGLDGDGALVGEWNWNIAQFNPTGPDCTAPALHCLAKADLASKSGDIALATSTRLGSGAPSMLPCIRNLRLNEIVYSNDGRITISRPDGTHRRTLTNGGRTIDPAAKGDDEPALSRDGNLVAFVRNGSPRHPGGDSLRLIDIRGDELLTLAESGAGETRFRDPVFDPDGLHIFHVRTGPDQGVIRTELNGAGATDVAGGIPDSLDLRFTDIDLSPDGETLLVGMEGFRAGDGHPIARIYEVRLSTGKAILLQEDASHGAFSPDGERIVFESKRDGIGLGCPEGRCSADRRLYSMDADGSDARRIFPEEGRRDEISPDFSPDGNRISFTSDRSGQWQVHIARPDGECLDLLTSGNLANYSASWGYMFESERPFPDCGETIREPGKDTGPTVRTRSVCGKYPVSYPRGAGTFFRKAIRYRGAVVEFRGRPRSKGFTSAALLSGGRITSIEFRSKKAHGDPFPARKYLRVVDQLRSSRDPGQPAGVMPAARMGRNAVTYNRRLLGFHGNHTLAETARRFGQNRRSVFYQLKAARQYRKLGVKPIACPGS